jgi:hypothetical protein
MRKSIYQDRKKKKELKCYTKSSDGGGRRAEIVLKCDFVQQLDFIFRPRRIFSLVIVLLRTSLVEKLFFTRSVELPLHEKDGIDREMREARKKPIFQIIEWFHGTHWHA